MQSLNKFNKLTLLDTRISQMMIQLMLIGTAHVIDLSLPIDRHMRNFEPDLVALELDKQRWYALKSESKVSQGPFYLRLLAKFQRY